MSHTAKWFAQRVQVDSAGCWIWLFRCDPDGYGRSSGRKAHRLSYLFFRGPIPVGLQLDHLCRVRSCCNPEHLEAVTPGENVRRGVAARAGEGLAAICPDHDMIPNAAGKRVCKACDYRRKRAYYLATRSKLKKETA